MNAEAGTVFASSDFADIADMPTIRKSLQRLTQNGTLWRILKDIFEKPKYSDLLKEYVVVDPNAVAKALTHNYHWTIVSCGNTALKAYGMEIEDRWTLYGECTCRPVLREDEQSMCLVYDWIYLPSA